MVLILTLIIQILFASFNHNATAEENFQTWLLSYKKFALEKGISQETINTAFKSVKFLEQVIKYDRKQPEFFEDTRTYVKKRATASRAKTAKKLLNKNEKLLEEVENIFDVENILKSGADKVAINTAAIANPKLITEVAKKFGSQCVVLSIEAKKLDNNYWEAYTHNGMEKTGIDVLKWIKKGIDYGAGEILLTSVDKEGTKTGFDLDLIFKSSSICKVPLIASGGCGETNHLDHLLERTHIDAIAVASILHYNLSNIKNLKDNIKNFYNKKK